MIPTPDYGRLHDSVYEPAEDTFILLDALEKDAEEIKALLPTICLEIGSGSGVASAFLNGIIGQGKALFISTDINPEACLATRNTSKLNDADLNPINTNLIAPLIDRIKQTGGVDVLLFNPPYVPTEEHELTKTQLDGEIGATWAGGFDGMDVTNLILNQLPNVLQRPGSRLYLVAVAENKPQAIIDRMVDLGFEGEIVLKRRAGREFLHVIRLIRR